MKLSTEIKHSVLDILAYFHTLPLHQIYQQLRFKWPHLCDDYKRYPSRDEPYWQHSVRSALFRLKVEGLAHNLCDKDCTWIIVP